MEFELSRIIKQAIEQAIPQSHAEIEVHGSHASISVISPIFEGKRTLDQQRLVYQVLKPFMSGDNPPLHAVDQLKTSTT